MGALTPPFHFTEQETEKERACSDCQRSHNSVLGAGIQARYINPGSLRNVFETGLQEQGFDEGKYPCEKQQDRTRKA